MVAWADHIWEPGRKVGNGVLPLLVDTPVFIIVAAGVKFVVVISI